jgi:hypothetical protein
MAAALTRAIPEGEALEDHTLNVVVATDDQKIAGVGAREAWNDTAGTRERKLPEAVLCDRRRAGR